MNPFVTISPQANDELGRILDFIEQNFGKAKALECLGIIEKLCWQIAAFPFLFPAYKKKSVRKAVVTKHLSMFYQVRKDTIEILQFWDNRRNPDSFKPR